ncbi:RNase adapter RapZ [Thermodesulfobacteriota bacterium]
MTERKLIIISGLSGSGKSTVAKTLEDLGFFCVDNIPVDLLPKLLELTDSRGSELDRLALVIDSRQREFFPHYGSLLRDVELSGTPLEVVFLETRDAVIVRRYSETRRQHPLASDGNVQDAINRERNELTAIKQLADWVLDTSDMTVHGLRDEIRRIFGQVGAHAMRVTVNSFGFGRGVPMGSDLVWDVRFLPNPYFVRELKAKDGRSNEVAAWIMAHITTRKFLDKLEDLLLFLLPLYIMEGRQYLTISVGCTGGRHRSVVVAEHIYGLLAAKSPENVEINHRELDA